MSLSFRLGSLFGIPLRIHFLFVVLVIGVAASNGSGRAPQVVAYLLMLFGSVLLHELGHALTARRLGARIHDIVLWPLGGLARMSDLPERPGAEFAVAVAGPAANMIVCAAAFAAGARPSPEGAFARAPWLEELASMNFAMAALNLVPAFPMDGGRALRALLFTRTTYLRATEIAVRIGRWIAILVVAGAFFLESYFWTICILAAFLWIQGMIELSQVRARYGADPMSAFLRAWMGAAQGAAPAGGAPPREESEARRTAPSSGELNDRLENYRGTLEEFFREKKD